MLTTSWIDRSIGAVSPRWQLKRLRARLAADFLTRTYEAAGQGRRQSGWKKSGGDANATIGPVTGTLRQHARALVENNPYAESALSTIADHTVGGWGIEGSPKTPNARALKLWQEWTGTTACDADGINTFAGLQKLVQRTIVRDGECLVRFRLRKPEDGLPIPLQLQVLEPDFLDSLKHVDHLPNGGRIVHGVELDALGRRVAFWLYKEHPGSGYPGLLTSVRVPAEHVLHLFRPIRAGQLRGVTWYAPVILRFKDFDEFEDATLMKQKIAACLAVITSDANGDVSPLGADSDPESDIDSLEPGAVLNIPAGRNVTVVDPPRIGEYADYTSVTLRSIATGLGVTYEDLTGDYTDLPFSAARMSRLRHWARVHDWQWNLLIPQFCDPVWRQAMTIAAIGQHGVPGIGEIPLAEWTPQPPPMIDPEREGLAYLRFIRGGLMSHSEALRERGYDPQKVFSEIAADNKLLDKLGLVFDTDPRRMTQAGQAQPAQATGEGSTKIDTEDEDRALARILEDLPRRDRIAVLAAIGGGR